MDTIMFHTGGVTWLPENKLPLFIECNFKQFRLFNPEVNVYFLTDKQHLSNEVFKKYNILPFDKDQFYSNKIREFESLFNIYDKNDFWTVTATRLIYIENFMADMNLTNVYHFENDVLIYYNLAAHDKTFRSLYNDMAITVGGEIVAMTGFMFIKHSGALADMTKYFIDMLRRFGIQGTCDRYRIPMVNEMFLMRQYGIDFPGQLRNLPTMPFGEYSENVEAFNSLFDPASYGQFVGGTQSEGPGAMPQDHYIGRWLKKNPQIYIYWNDEGLNLPYLVFDKKVIKINNLHIHSKNLHKYMSV